AIAAMRALPATDGRNWTNQAKVHNSKCWHNSWFFFPWHRDYLMRFENIIRQQCKDDSFVIPYWNWTEHPAIPDAFMKGAGDAAPVAFTHIATKSGPRRAPAKTAKISSQIGDATNAD